MVFLTAVLSAQTAHQSSVESEFQEGYQYLLTGKGMQALDFFDKLVFEEKNYDAMPYYRAACCSVTEKEAPSLNKILKATKKAKKAKSLWGAAMNKKEFLKAQSLIEQKAAAGNAVAQYNMGTAFYDGRVVKKNYELAFKYFEQAADQGLSCSKFILGRCYAEGTGVDKNLKKGIKLMEEAIELNPKKSSKKYLKKLESK